MSFVDDIRQMRPADGEPVVADAPPAPPPAPEPGGRRTPTQRPQRRQLPGWVARMPFRYQLAGAGVIVVAATVIATRAFIDPVDEDAITRAATVAALEQTRGELNVARGESTQIAVPLPFANFGCPLTFEAMGAIGGDPATGGRTINAQRAAPLERQAQQLLVGARLPDLRLVSPNIGELKVVVGGTDGMALLNCIPNNVAPIAPPATEPAPSTTVAVAAGG